MARTRPAPAGSERPRVDSPAAALGWGARVAVVVGLGYVAAFLGVAFLRLRYPFELEWMEGSSIAHLDRVMRGLPLYGKPSLDFTPFIYPPLYFTVTSWVAKLTGVGFVPLRLVSIAASVGCLWLIYLYVRGVTRSPWAPLLGACLFAATYRQGGAWLDLGRVDTLSLCFLLAGGLALRRVPAPWIAGLAGGALFTLAAFTKQSALFVAAPVAAALIVTDWRRGTAFAASLSALFAAAAWGLDRASGGWFLYYAFELPRHHPIIGQLLRGFWIQDLLGPVGIALAIGAAHFFAAPVRPRLRALALDGALCAGLIATGYATRIHVGSFINVVIPAYLGVSLLFGLGLATLWEHRGGAPRLAERYVVLLVLAQYAVLAYKPWQQLPSARDRQAGEQIVESLRRVPGEVWVPRHPYLAVMAGKPWLAHELALQDVLRPRETPRAQALLAEIQAAAHARRFSLLVLDDQTWVYGEFRHDYRHAAEMFAANETDLFWPKTGFVTRPDFVWAPRDSGSAPDSGPPPAATAP